MGVMEEKESPGGRLVTKVLAKRVTKAKEVETVRLTFKREGVIGKGSFGVVQLVRLQRVSPVHGDGEELEARDGAQRDARAHHSSSHYPYTRMRGQCRARSDGPDDIYLRAQLERTLVGHPHG